MADRLALLAEANRRGILPADKKPLFDEAVRRGLIPGEKRPTPAAGIASSPMQADVLGKIDTLKDVRDAVANSEALTQVGKAGGMLGKGILSLSNLPIMGLNAALDAAGIDYRAMTVSDLLKMAGASQPRDTLEKYVDVAGTGVAGAAGGIGLGSGLAGSTNATTQGVGQVLQQNPLIQGVSGATGAVSSQVAADAGFGPVGQLVAGIAGGAAPSIIAAGSQAVTRGGFRGGEAGRQTVEQNIDDFAKAGTTPTVGQATQGRLSQGGESLLSRTPGSAGRMVGKAANQADEIQAAVNQQADNLAPVAGADEAGLAITKGIRGSGGFVETFKAKQGELYRELDKYIPKQQPVDVSNTKTALEALNADIPGAPEISKWFKNNRIQGIQKALDSDTGAGQSQFDSFLGDNADNQNFTIPPELPFEAVKKLRTLVGDELADSSLRSDILRDKWKALYAGLSADLKTAADDAGPEASNAWSRATTYTRAGHRRIEVIGDAIDKAGGPEKVYQAVTSGTKDGATVLRSVMQSLPPDAQKVVTATVLRRLGTAKAGVQNATGDAFSTETYLTNWNNLSPAAKRTLFDRHGATFRADLDTVAKVTSNIREGSKVFRNPSGTEQATAQASAVTASVVALVTGRLDVLAGIAAGVAGANLSARLMTNPNFVHWLAGTTKFPPGAYASQVNVLANLAKTKNDPELAEAARLLQQEGNQGQQQERRQQQQ